MFLTYSMRGKSSGAESVLDLESSSSASILLITGIGKITISKPMPISINWDDSYLTSFCLFGEGKVKLKEVKALGTVSSIQKAIIKH